MAITGRVRAPARREDRGGIAGRRPGLPLDHANAGLDACRDGAPDGWNAGGSEPAGRPVLQPGDPAIAAA